MDYILIKKKKKEGREGGREKKGREEGRKERQTDR